MTRFRKISAGFLFACLLSGGVHAAFEPMGYGAAATGLGGAYVAAAEDGTAAYWNPANLSLVRCPQLTASVQDLYNLGVLRYNAIGYTQPRLGEGTLGLHFLRLQTTGEGSFLKYAENTYLIGYGRRLWGPLAGGAGVRFYSTSSPDNRSSAIGGDLGLLLRPRHGRFRLGLDLQDITEPRLHSDQSDARDVIPPTTRLGAYAPLGSVLGISVQNDWRRHEKPIFRAGASFNLLNRMVVMRAGTYHRADGDWAPALGLGVRYGRLAFDYGWDQGDDLGNTQNVSFSFCFGSEGPIIKKAEAAKPQNPPPAPPPALKAPAADSDQDGVPDDSDKCPGTPPGVRVVSDGCPWDTDKDGVPDSNDKCPDTLEGLPVNAEGCPPESVSFNLDVKFDSGQTVIKAAYVPQVQALADFLKKYPEATAAIEGHTDNQGSSQTNLSLSKRRAESVRRYLIDQGIDPSRLKAQGFGSSRPVSDNASARGREKNRRVVMALKALSH